MYNDFEYNSLTESQDLDILQLSSFINKCSLLFKIPFKANPLGAIQNVVSSFQIWDPQGPPVDSFSL